MGLFRETNIVKASEMIVNMHRIFRYNKAKAKEESQKREENGQISFIFFLRALKDKIKGKMFQKHFCMVKIGC